MYLLVLALCYAMYLSGCPVRSAGERGAKISSVVIEVPNKQESSITYSLSPRILSNITEGFQQLLNLPFWYCKVSQLLKSTMLSPTYCQHIVCMAPQQIGQRYTGENFASVFGLLRYFLPSHYPDCVQQHRQMSQHGVGQHRDKGKTECFLVVLTRTNCYPFGLWIFNSQKGKEIRKCTVLWKLNPIQIERKKHKTRVNSMSW